MITTNYYSLFGRNKNTIWHSLTWEEAEFLKWQFFLYFTGNNFAVGTVWFLSKGVKFCDDVKKFNMKKSKEILLPKLWKLLKLTVMLLYAFCHWHPKCLEWNNISD